MSRANRRHHNERIKNNRKRYWGSAPMTPERIGKVLHTPKVCNCWMCANPRAIYGKSFSELKAEQDIEDDPNVIDEVLERR